MPLKGGKKVDDDDDDYEDDYVDDDDDEDEDDFIPGVDDDDDDGGEYEDEDGDSDNDEDTNQSIQLLDGILTLDVTSKQLQYTGDTFHLQTSEPLPYNVLDAAATTNTTPSSSMITFFMEGHCNVTPNDSTTADAGTTDKNNSSKFQITLSLQDNNTDDDQPTTTKNFKKGDDEDDDDDDDEEEKKGTSKQKVLPSKLYQVYGQEIVSNNNDSSKANVIEFTGSYHPVTDKNESSLSSVPMICVVRFVPVTKSPTKHATPVAAAAARSTNSDDDDDDNGDPDEDVDYDELIALHEDAGLPVETVRKRYRGGDGGNTDDGSSLPKKPKASPTKPPPPDYDDDDDEDVGF